MEYMAAQMDRQIEGAQHAYKTAMQSGQEPAFPTESAAQTGTSTWRYEGMTLRDYFAAKALPLAFQYWRECTDGVDGDFVFARTEGEGEMDLIAADCYQMADAMLAARSK